MKVYNLSEVELRGINGGTEESYNIGKEIGEHIRGIIDGLKGLF